MSFHDLPILTEDQTRYNILGIANDATDEELHRAYRRMAMLYHPDRHTEEDQQLAQAAFHQVSEAYRILSDPDTRQRYDHALARGEAYSADSPDPNEISLADILRSLEDFERPDTGEMNAVLKTMIQNNLQHQLGEQVLEVWRLTEAPAGATIKGSLGAAVAVLTNLRLLMPYTYSWTESTGSKKIKYTATEMISCLMPQTQRIDLYETGHLKRRLEVRFIQEKQIFGFNTDRMNFGKLFVVARRWGVPIQAGQKPHLEARAAERRWAIRPLWYSLAAVAVYFFAAAACRGMFTDDDAGKAFSHAFASLYPVAVWIILLYLAWSVARGYNWIVTYRSETLHDIRTQSAGPGIGG